MLKKKQKTVPFHKAKLNKHNVKLFNGLISDLSNSRRVETWRVDSGGFAIRIFRLDNNGKTSKLLFGLSEDAATVLSIQLIQQLLNVNVKNEAREGGAQTLPPEAGHTDQSPNVVQ